MSIWDRFFGKGKAGIDADAIRELSELLQATGLTEIEIEKEGARIRVCRAAAVAVAAAAIPALAAAPPVVAAVPAAGPHPGTVPSPMVGTVFVAAEPGKPPFISVGQSVKEGDTIFIVEAMKTMNPITAPKGGTVMEINVSNGQPVEYGQALAVIG